MDVTCVSTPASLQPRAGIARVLFFHAFLFLTLLGTAPPVSGAEQNLNTDTVKDAIITLDNQGGTLLIGTVKELLKWEGAPKGQPERVPVDTGTVYFMLHDHDTLWIGCDNGLVRWDTPERGGNPELIPNSPKSIIKLLKLGERLLISATGGLYVLQPTPSTRFIPLKVAGRFVDVFYLDGDRTAWIGSERGLFRLNVEDEMPMPVPASNNINVTSLLKEGSTLIAGTAKGLLLVHDEVGSSPNWVLSGADIYSLHRDSATILVSTLNKGLFRWDDIRSGQPELIADDIGTSSKYYRNGSVLWMGAGMASRANLYRWDVNKERQPRRMPIIDTGAVHSFCRIGDTLWIGAGKGLFRLDGQATDWDAGIKITSDLPDNLFADNSLLIQWQVDNFGWRTTRELAQYRIIIVDDETGQEVPVDNASISGQEELTIPRIKAGTYKLYVQATDLNGRTAKSRPKEFTVYLVGQSILFAKIKPYLIYALGSLLVLVVLSPRVILLLSHVDILWINQLALFFYLHSLGRWKLYRRYRARLRASPEVQYSGKHYVDLPFEANTYISERTRLPDLFTGLSVDTRVVIVADGGRGKSTLCYCVADRCITKRDLFGGKLLEPVLVDSLMYTGDMFKAVTNALRQGRAYVNTPILESQLAAGNLLVIFDGFSEIREKHLDTALEDIPSFIRQYPDTPFIITSRSSLPPSVQQALTTSIIITLRDVDESTQRVFFAKRLQGGEDEVDALLQALEDRLASLPRIPLMLKLIASFYNQKHTVPDNAAALFDEYVGQILRPEVRDTDEVTGLKYAIHHLVRETYLRSGGDRGFTMDQGVEALDKIKDKFASYDIELSPIKLLRLLIRAGLYKEFQDNLRFFHDSFESYFAARALTIDFREKRYRLLKGCANNERFSETMKFLEEMIMEPKERRKLNKILSRERNAS